MRDCPPLTGAALLLAMLLLAACSAAPDRPQLAVSQAHLVGQGDGVALDMELRFRPSPLQLDALDHGVPLILDLRISGEKGGPVLRRQLGLRYFPLSRRYQLHMGSGADRSFALRGYLLDALQRLHLPLPLDPCAGGSHCQVEARLNYSRLPGALRLPALLRPQWRVPVAQAEVNRS